MAPHHLDVKLHALLSIACSMGVGKVEVSNHCRNAHDCSDALCRHMWSALGPMTEALAFEFYEAVANMQPAEVALPGKAFADGICNAVVFWFTLHLDEETELHTGPYADKVRMRIASMLVQFHMALSLLWLGRCSALLKRAGSIHT